MQIRFRRARAPDEIKGVKIPYDKRQRGAHRLAWYLILAVVLSPILYLAARALAASYSYTANGTVALDEMEIRAGELAVVRELKVNPGDRITAGQLLAVLDSAELDAALARNGAQLESGKAADRDGRTARAAIGQELDVRERSVWYRRDRRAGIERLVHQGAATLAELDAATADLAVTETALLQVRRELAAQNSAADSAPAERAVLEARRRALTIHAPFDGRTLEVPVKPGQYVSAGEPMIIVAQLDRPRVIAFVPPKFGTNLEVGTPATVHFPDGMRLHARVAAAPRLTQRMPADLVDQFGLRPMTVVLQLLPQDRWPDADRVQGLPVVVRFEAEWEHGEIGAGIGRALGWFAR